MVFLSLQDVKDTLEQYKPMFDKLMVDGKDILEAVEPGPDREKLEHKLSDANERWEAAVVKTQTQETKLDEIRPVAKTYHSATVKFVPWLEITEKNVAPVQQLTRDPQAVSKQQELVTKTLREVQEHTPEFEEVTKDASATLDLAQSDEYVVEGEVQDIKKRWSTLVDMLNTKEDQLGKLMDAAEVYEHAQNSCKKPFEEVTKFLEECKPSGIDQDLAEKQREKAKEKLALLELSEGDVSKVSCYSVL
jgi:soluble cytochrome b562